MTTQLPERLRVLAEEAPGPLSGQELWRAGRRRQRTRVATALVVAGVLVLGGALTGFGNWRSQQPDPAAPPATGSGPMSIPDRFYDPSPWLPTSRDPGRLVAIIPDVSHAHVLRSATSGVVGVAAGSQRYTFLDLPDQDTGSFPSTVALSPDGLHVAYVIDGPVPDIASKESDAVGVAVLDVATGRVERHPISGELGLDNVELRWVSDTELMTYATWPPRSDDPSSSSHMRNAWTRFVVGSGSGQPIPPQTLSDPAVFSPSGAVYGGGRRQLVVFRSSHTGRVVSSLLAPRWNGLYDGAVDAPGTRFATFRGNGTPARLMWGRDLSGKVALQDVPGRYGTSLLQWADPHHVVAAGVRRDSPEPVWQLVDVRDGSTRTLVSHPGAAVVAADAFTDAHSVHAVPPPDPWNLRSLLIAVLVGLLVLGAAAWWAVRGAGRVRR